METEPRETASFSAARRWGGRVSVGVALISVAALAVMLNYLAARHFVRTDWSGSRRTELSPRTLNLLASLTNQVKVTVYFDRQTPLFGLVSALLNEYRYQCPRLVVEEVDYLRNSGEAKLVQAKYRLTQVTDKDVVIFDYDGRVKKVYATELGDTELEQSSADDPRAFRRKLTNFKGEILFSSALLSVISAQQPKAYFLQGHGEHSPDSDSKRSGYSQMAAVLRDNNLTVASLTNLVSLPSVPVDCRLLIIAGPTTALLPTEAEKLDQYLARGGRALVLLGTFGINRDGDLVELLSRWGARVGNNRVVDRENTANGEDVLAKQYGAHEIMRPLSGLQLHLLLPRTAGRSRGDAAKTDTTKAEDLVLTGPRATVATQTQNGIVYPNEARDYRGEVPLVVAVEKGGIPGIATDRGTTRLIVAGDSFFLSNLLIESVANRDFANLAVNWLLDRTRMMEIGPQPVHEYRLALTRQQLNRLRWLLLVLLPGSVLLVGFLVWLRRRR